jgi:uncharacterized protein YbjT (DUF2867 family)
VKILVTGATGFVGPKIVHALRAEDRDVRAVVRRPERAGSLASWGVELVAGDVTDAESIAKAAEGCTHVVHLVAIITGTPEQFRRVMIEGTRNVIAAAKAAGVQRFVLMSALGTNEQTKDLVPYYNAKWTEEQDVAASGLEHVIMRPSFVFGPGGGALATFVKQVKYSPVGRRRLGRPLPDDREGARQAAQDRARPRRHRGRRCKARAAAPRRADHRRPGEDDRGARQRRVERRRRRHLQDPAPAARRADPPLGLRA